MQSLTGIPGRNLESGVRFNDEMSNPEMFLGTPETFVIQIRIFENNCTRSGYRTECAVITEIPARRLFSSRDITLVSMEAFGSGFLVCITSSTSPPWMMRLGIASLVRRPHPGILTSGLGTWLGILRARLGLGTRRSGRALLHFDEFTTCCHPFKIPAVCFCKLETVGTVILHVRTFGISLVNNWSAIIYGHRTR